MAQPVYKLFLAKPAEAWHQLSEEEQADLMAKVHASLENAGGKAVLSCDSSWSSEQWPFFGVEEFPDIEGVQKHAQELNELNWFRYGETLTILGTKWEPS
jgi:hypothetical protein